MGTRAWVEENDLRYVLLVAGHSDGEQMLALVRELHRLIVAEPPGPMSHLVDCRDQPLVLVSRLMTETKRLRAHALRTHTLRTAVFGPHLQWLRQRGYAGAL